MINEEASPVFQVWGTDGIVYGPIDLPTLCNWVKEQRINGETWIYHGVYDRWQKAELLPELQITLRTLAPKGSGPSDSTPVTTPADVGLKPKAIRRIKVFVNFDDTQLETFLTYMEVISTKQWDLVVKHGDPGGAMYLVLDGEVRVRMMIMAKENVLTTLTTGDFFGEVSLFDHGPRSADVVANRDSLLLCITAASFGRLVKEQPQLAAPFLQSICITLTSRIRADNKRFKESIKLIRSASHYNNL